MLVMELDILTQALRLYARGLAVFPVDIQTKTPLVSGYHGLNAARATEEKVREWFTGTDHAMGIACGPISDIILLDFDFKKHPEAREFYEANRHRIPRTWWEETGSGGWHFYFRWDKQLNDKQTNTTSKLWKGVDTKGHGGYSKITPSPGYKWIVPPHLAALAMCPQWLIDMLQPKEKDTRNIPGAFASKPEDWMIRELENVDPKDPVNGRTPTFVRAIGRLKAKGLTPLEVTKFLTQYAQQYEYPNIEGLVNDQFRRYPPRPATAAVEEESTSHSFLDFIAKLEPRPYLVPGLIAENTINIVAGLQESRKSWLLLDLAVGFASGTNWLSRFPCQRRKVMLIDQERPKAEMQRRIAALLKSRDIAFADLEGYLVPKVGTTFRINMDQSYQKLTKLIEEVQPEIVLIDSLKAFQNGDICNNQSMQEVFERFKELRSKYGLTFVILHHENKGAYFRNRENLEVTAENIAGAAVINEVPEGLFVAKNHDLDSSFLHHVKNSYGTKIAPFIVKVKDLTPDKSEIAVEAY